MSETGKEVKTMQRAILVLCFLFSMACSFHGGFWPTSLPLFQGSLSWGFAINSHMNGSSVVCKEPSFYHEERSLTDPKRTFVNASCLSLDKRQDPFPQREGILFKCARDPGLCLQIATPVSRATFIVGQRALNFVPLFPSSTVDGLLPSGCIGGRVGGDPVIRLG